MSEKLFSRRRILAGGGALLAPSAFARAQGTRAAAPRTQAAPAAGSSRARPTIDSGPRVAPVGEIVLVREFEDSARLTLSPAVFSTVAGTDHQGFDRITLRPRMLVPTMDLDLGVDLFGDRLFTPIVVGPVADQKRFHADAELATVRGAAAGKAAVMVSSQSSVPIEQIAAEAKTPLWYQVWAGAEAPALVQRAVQAGVRAVCVTLGAASGAPAAEPDWGAIDALRQGLKVPLLVKGIVTAAEARTALQHGAQGIVVSTWGRSTQASSILALPAIVDAVAGKVPVLVDGSFRLGTDIYKALAYGAQGVLIGRPVAWGLAAYGADGVRTVVELLQSELGRIMAMSGNSNLKTLGRQYIKLHATAMRTT